MIATNELAACRPPSGTSVLRPTAIPRPQPQHPRSIAPRQSQSRTAYNPLADLLEDDLPAHCSPSQPPLPRVLRRTIESALDRPVKPVDDSEPRRLTSKPEFTDYPHLMNSRQDHAP